MADSDPKIYHSQVQYLGYEYRRARRAYQPEAGAPGTATAGVGEHATELAAIQQAMDDRSATEREKLSHGLDTRHGPDIGDHNYESYSHPDLHRMVTKQVDPNAVDEVGSAWTDVGNELARMAGELHQAIGASEATWLGDAGDAARRSLTAVARHLGNSGKGAQLIGTHLADQSQQASAAKNAMPEPVAFDASAATAAFRSNWPELVV